MAFGNRNVYGGMTLKALLENPDLHHAPAALTGGPSLKGKKDGGGGGDIDFTSAFLGPQLWDKTFEASDFNLEYMDLDEFLSENGIPNSIPVVDGPTLDRFAPHTPSSPPVSIPPARPSPQRSPISPCSLSRSPPHTGMGVMPVAGVMPVVGMVENSRNFLVESKPEIVEHRPAVSQGDLQSSSPKVGSPIPTPPVSPLPLQVEFRLTEQDIALSSIPGQREFDPTACSFNEEELKPQPMIKKSKKVFIPEDLKDDKYWARRKKNNYAAKRSRDARRVKENQIAIRAAYLEKENATLKEEMEKVRRDNAKLKQRLSKYETP